MRFGHSYLHDAGNPADWDLRRALEVQRAGKGHLRKVRSIAPTHVWEQFLNVRAGRTANPSPPEVGLRMARLWDAIRASTARGGAVVDVATARDAAGDPLPDDQLPSTLAAAGPSLAPSLG